MKSATFTNNGMKIKATALNSAGMGFLSGLQNSGQYTEEEAIELCFEKDGDLVSVEELQTRSWVETEGDIMNSLERHMILFRKLARAFSFANRCHKPHVVFLGRHQHEFIVVKINRMDAMIEAGFQLAS